VSVIVSGLAILAGSASQPACGRNIEVAPSPTGEPVLARAIQAAAGGDTLQIKDGLYRETIVVDKCLHLIGAEGAILDPSQPWKAAWQPAADVGKGAYRAIVAKRPYALLLDGKVVAEIDPRRTSDEGPWFWRKLLASGTPRSGFRFVRAIWVYREAEKAVYLHLADDVSPQPLRWSILWTKEPVVAIRGAAGASVRGLTLAHGFIGAVLLGHCAQCTVSQCVIGPWERHGVLLSDGAADCLVEHNRIFRGAYEDWAPRENSKDRYEIWQIHKTAGYYDRVGINVIRAGANNRIHANHIWETFDGIDLGDSSVESLDIPLGSPDDGKGTEIWENTIERTRDSGIELGVGCVGVRVHHNTLRETHGGLRFKLPRIGPVFIYRNLLVDGAPFNIWYSMDDSPAEGYVYHNTIVGGKVGLAYSSFNRGGHGIGAPHWSYFNNLIVADHGFFENRRVNAPVNFTADYNLVVGGGKPWPAAADKDRHSLYLPQVPLSAEYRPLPDSPAIDAGVDLSAAYHGQPLPGCEPGYFRGAAPDIGAFEVK
jgi:hypothetical protein